MSLFADVLHWWVDQLVALVPARLRTRDGDGGDALLVDQGQDGSEAKLGVALRRRGREVSLGRLPLDGAAATGLRSLLKGQRPVATLLRLPADRLLERVVTLPLAAERDLGRVLGYEFDRFTPFAAADVYWSWTVLQQDRVRREMQVRLSLVPKAMLAPVFAVLRAAGQAPTGLRVMAIDGQQRRIGLVAEDARAGRGQRRALLAAGGVCALLALVAACLPILLPYQALLRIEADIERLRPQLDEVAALRRRIAQRSSADDVLGAEEARLGKALEAIALLTEVLPDDTYLTAFTLRQRQVTLTGQSADAARLIPRLSADPMLRDVVFLSPVTRAEPSRAELFSLRLELGR